MKIRKYFTLIILLFSIGCSSQTNNDIFGLEEISDINRSLILQNPNKSIFIGKSFSLAIINNSDQNIKFSVDHNVKIFERIDNHWNTIDDEMMPMGEGYILSPSDKNPIGILTVLPKVTTNKDTIVRIIISGKMISSGEEIAAYIDMMLEKP